MFSLPRACCSTPREAIWAGFAPRHVLAEEGARDATHHGEVEGEPSTAARVAMEMGAGVKGRMAA